MATKFWKSTSSTSFNTAGNWSDGAAPLAGDTLIFNYLGTASVASNLDSNLTNITLIVEKSYSGNIGVLSATAQTYLELDGGTVYLETPVSQGSPTGSQLLMIMNSNGTSSPTAMTVYVYDSAQTSSSTYNQPILLTGDLITLNHYGGKVGISTFAGETCASATIRVTPQDATVSPNLTIGRGVTIASLTGSGGIIKNESTNTNTAVAISDGCQYDYVGTGAHTALTVANGASCYYSGTGTLTAGTVAGSTLSFGRDARAKTITNLTVRAGSTLDLANGDPASLTFTNAIQFPDGMTDVRVITPYNMKALPDNI